jgi:hypothetical protein
MTNKKYGVTEEQIDACTRVKNERTGETFYLVQSASDATVTYQVHYHQGHNRLTCTCKAGQSSNNCWHRRAVAEHNRQYHELKKAEAAAARRIEEQELLTRVMNAKPYQPSEAEVQRDLKRYAPRPFSLLR